MTRPLAPHCQGWPTSPDSGEEEGSTGRGGRARESATAPAACRRQGRHLSAMVSTTTMPPGAMISHAARCSRASTPRRHCACLVPFADGSRCWWLAPSPWPARPPPPTPGVGTSSGEGEHCCQWRGGWSRNVLGGESFAAGAQLRRRLYRRCRLFSVTGGTHLASAPF